jgi:transposase-like protein
MSKRRTFSREFKFEAVRALNAGDKKAADLARELGVPRNKLYRWKEEIEQHGEQAFPGSGREAGATRSQEASELNVLRKENARLKEDLAILKKAAIYFAKDHT